PPHRPQYAPPPPPQYPAYAPPNFPPSGPQPVPSNFPAYPPAPEKAEPRGKKKLLIGIAAAVVVVLAAGLTVFLTSSSSVTTYTADQCKTPGQADDRGFTGCLRQLAGKIADTGDCKPGMGNGPAAPAQRLGASSTCSAPGRAGTQVTYVHGDSADTLKQYTDGLLASAGGDRTEADWGGNGLKGHYSSAAGKTSAVLVFTVADRPLAGFIYQLNTSDQAQVTTPGTLADYFEASVQPGE
ncbi:molecular chaperone Hsp70, partial [Amycolatopsis vancoresmycina DSM 44592]